MGRPIADHSEYRPPTQSQNTNMFFVSMPKAPTARALVDTATKCFAIASRVPPFARNHSRAVAALAIVSCVVKVLDATRNSVVAGSSPRSVSAMCVPSTLDTKCARSSRLEYGLSASHTISGPRSEPPMPIFTKSVIGFPV